MLVMQSLQLWAFQHLLQKDCKSLLESIILSGNDIESLQSKPVYRIVMFGHP